MSEIYVGLFENIFIIQSLSLEFINFYYYSETLLHLGAQAVKTVVYSNIRRVRVLLFSNLLTHVKKNNYALLNYPN